MSKIAKSIQKGRMGLSVQEVLDVLSKIEDKTKPCCTHSFGFEMVGVQDVTEETLSGYAGSYSFEETDVVAIV